MTNLLSIKAKTCSSFFSFCQFFPVFFISLSQIHEKYIIINQPNGNYCYNTLDIRPKSKEIKGNIMEIVESAANSEKDLHSSPYVQLSVANHHGERTTKSEVVISGISGKFPESSNVEEFAENLFSGVDMVTDDDRRWPPGLMGLPTRSGKLKELDKFDAGHFGVNSKLANFMDPQLRILHELTFEAILDAGVNPSSIRGSKTGVFIGTSVSESETMWTQDPENTNGYPLVGSNKAMFANRISFSFDFHGPSFTVDTACSSSLLALELALSSIRKGDCDSAIVAGVHLCLSPMSCINTNRLHMLSKDGKCKSFDASGKGYVRSEAVVVVYIQKKDLAIRSYATIVHAKTNADGFKALGVTFPSGDIQAKLLEEVYEEAGVDPREVTYVEAHGTGTPAGDPQEMNAITSVFCKEGRDPNKPLLVGSVKSNLGHSEPSSGLCGVVKVLIAFQRGEIPANLHFKKANPDIPALADGRIKVVTQNTKWEGGIAGVNSFGFGGSNVHVILKSSPAGKSDILLPTSNLPLLVPFSGRTRDSVETVLRALVIATPSKETETKVDQELISLMHAIYMQNSGNIAGHNHRGYAVFNPHEGQLLDMEIREHAASTGSGQKSPIWFIFSGMGSQWKGMAKDALIIPAFAQSIKRSQSTLNNYINDMSQFPDFDLEKILIGENSTKQDSSNKDQSIIETFVSIVAVQIGLVDLLKSVGIEPDGIIGHSLGELSASYADGCMTAEQTILAALCRGMATEEIRNRGEMPLGAMASIGLTWEEAVKRCPPGIYPACHNSVDNVTVSGPALLIQEFISELEKEGVFARKVDTNDYAFHTPYISKAAAIFKKQMNAILPHPIERTKKWISSSFPQSKWKEDTARLCSGEYHANNMISPVLFKECLEHVPPKALVIEIGPHSLLQSILKRSLLPENGHAHIGMMNKNHPNNAICILNSIGKLYNLGHCPHFSRLYENEQGNIPKPVFPVSAATRSLSPLLKWDHGVSWSVARFDSFQNSTGGGFGGRSNHGEICMEISLKNEEDKFYQGHKIDSRLVFPATGYLLLVWKSFAQTLGRSFEQVPIVFEQVRIQRATFLPQNGSVKFLINIFQGSGEFQIREGDFVVMSGIVRSPNENTSSSSNSNEFIPFSDSILKNGATNHHNIEMACEDIYKELRLRGYEYSGEFQGIQKIQGNGAEIRWSGNFVSFLDTILQTVILSKSSRALFLPSFIDKLVIDPIAFLESMKEKKEDLDENCDEDHVDEDFPYEDEENQVKTVQVYYNEHSQLISCEGVQFQRIQATIAPKKNADHGKALKLETYKFAPYFDNDDNQNASKEDCLRICGGILSENCMDNMSIKFTQIIQQDSDSWISTCLHEFIQSQPLRTCAATVVHFPSETESESKLETKDKEEKEPEEKFNSLLKLGMTVTQLKREAPDCGKIVAETAVADDLIVLEKSPLNDFLVQNVIENLKNGAFLLLHCPISSFSLNSNNHNSKLEAELEILQEKYNLILVAHKISTETHFFLFKKIQSQNPAESKPKPIVIEIEPVDEDFPENYTYDWVDKLKEVMKEVAAAEAEKAENIPKVYAVSKETADATSGVVGLLNSLKLEPGGRYLRCFFIKTRSSSNISLTFHDPDEFLSQIMERDFFMNILEWEEDSPSLKIQNGQRGQWTWGSYRFLPLEIPPSEYVDHAYVNVLQRGNLATLRWFESPLKYYKNPSQICSVYYAALNFRDVMIASGKLPLDALPNNYGLQDCVLGMEFSGKTPNGQRVMGLLPSKALATSVIPHPDTMYNVPKNWTLKEAATVPVAFSTVYYGLIIRGKMRLGESILIHAGAGGVGIAAITLALHMKCQVYTTVGSEEKRAFLKKLFPQLQNDSFANSRDTSFLQHIMQVTKGKGVDLVLNSLSEEKLQASVKCLAQHGRFLEIGKLDLFKNSNLGMTIFLKNVSVHGILFDSLTDGDKDSGLVKELMEEGLKNGVVRPLPYNVFSDSDEEIENAFRTMAVGKHMGKILIQIRQEESESEKLNGLLSSSSKRVKALSRTYFDPTKIYIIVGGLGGFGLELCGWMIERGASKLVLTSRSGVKTGYQAYCLQKWAGQGAHVMTSTINVTTTDGATNLLQTAVQNFGGSPKFGGIGGIFNLAMVLADGLFENQTAENFIKASTPKINGSIALDQASRKLAPSLEYFICFSSAYSGRGGPGLSNYSWANSFLDRLCERRQREGYSALSIQWAAVGDVGVLQDDKKMGNETLIGGTIPQRIISCFNTLDIFLPRQDQHAVLSSIVIPEKRRRRNGGNGGSDDGLFTLTEKVAHILGIEKEEVKSVDPEKKLYELGMDSLMGVEIKQMIEMNTNVILTPKDVIDLTFGKIKEMKLSQNIENVGNPPESSAKDETLLDTNKNVQVESTPLKSESNGTFTTIEIAAESAETCQKAQNEKEIVKEPDFELDLSTPFEKTMVQKFKRGVKSCFLYIFGLFFMLFLGTLLLISLSIRQLFKLSLTLSQLFSDRIKYKIVDLPCAELFAMNPRTSNVIYTSVCSGVPYKSNIIKTLDQRLVNWRTNIVLDKETTSEDPEYQPYEPLKWRVEKGLFFHYWKKDETFNVRNHIIYEKCSQEADLQNEALRVSEFYHNYKWPVPEKNGDGKRWRPQWEVRVIAPKYDMNHPKESKEFLVVVAVHHVYGDAISGLHMLQYVFSDQKIPPSVVREQINGDIINGEEEKENDNKTSISNIEKMKEKDGKSHPSIFSPIIKFFPRVHKMALEMSRDYSECYSYKTYCKEVDSPRSCGVARFNLTRMKSIKNPIDGKSVPLTTVVLTCTAAAYEKLHVVNGKKSPKKICAMMPYAIFPYKRLGLLNNFSGACVPIPISFSTKNYMDEENPNLIPEQEILTQRMNMIQNSIKFSSTRDKLVAVWDLSCLFSLLTIQMNKLILYLSKSPTIVYTNVPATIPKHFTFFGGYSIKKFFGFTALVNKTQGTLASIVDSENDEVALSFVVDESVKNISPDFLNQFFKFFEEELEKLTRV